MVRVVSTSSLGYGDYGATLRDLTVDGHVFVAEGSNSYKSTSEEEGFEAFLLWKRRRRIEKMCTHRSSTGKSLVSR